MPRFEYYKPTVNLKWVTPNGDQEIVDMARVSVRDNEGKPTKLIKSMADRQHWSPFDMANMCVEVHAPRDISRQIIRHWSIHPQEFSQRYSTVDDDMFVLREARTQHPTNRQMSVDTDDAELRTLWEHMQEDHIASTINDYKEALALGIAKEQARVILPEGNTMSRLYLNGTVRSWITYLKVRQDIDATQREHVWVADEIAKLFQTHYPTVHAAFFPPAVIYEVYAQSCAFCPTLHGCASNADDLVHLVRPAVVATFGEDTETLVSNWQPLNGWARLEVRNARSNLRTYRDYQLIETENL